MRESYWTDSPDTRKMALMFVRNIWKVLIGMAAGALVCVLGYFIYHAVSDGTVYKGYSQFYIDFAIDENGNAAYDYYNGYTWNDLMTTDLIAGYTLDKLSDKSVGIKELEDITNAEILSDIRVLKVTFTDEDPERCADIQQATESALESLGHDAKEFDQISLIKSVKPAREYADDRLAQAVLLGVILGAVTALIVLRFAYILDDRVMIPSDLEAFDIPLIKICTAKEDTELAKRLNIFAKDDDDDADIRHIDAGRYADKDSDLPVLNADAPVMIDIPYRRVRLSALKLLTDRMIQNGMTVRGFIITDADNGFYKAYYGFGNKPEGD